MAMAYTITFFIALMATALALGGPLAHVLEFSTKIELPRDQYFIVQAIYAGWNRLAYLLAIQFASIIAVLIFARNEPLVFWSTIVSLLGLIAAQTIFWIFTYPANVATNNWTSIPENWEVLRRQWEYSHVMGALLQILSMGALCVAALARMRS